SVGVMGQLFSLAVQRRLVRFDLLQGGVVARLQRGELFLEVGDLLQRRLGGAGRRRGLWRSLELGELPSRAGRAAQHLVRLGGGSPLGRASTFSMPSETSPQTVY